MELKNIDIMRCPMCGALSVKETQNNQHASGNYNETRTFACGYELKYSPNFNSVSITSQCKNTEEFKIRTRKRKKAKEDVTAFIDSLDVDEAFKKSLKSYGMAVSCEW